MLIVLARQLSFLLFSIGSLGIFIYFTHRVIVLKQRNVFFSAVGFGLLSIASGVNFFLHAYTNLSFTIAIMAYSCLILSIVTDKHAIFPFTIPFPLIAILLLAQHKLLFSLALTTVIAYVYLSFKLSHQKLIPLLVAFSLVTIGEYFYSMQNSTDFPAISTAGIFMYLFAALILLGWLMFYLIREMITLWKSN